jgi:diguanylate cyclase (GGDEF)-like protein
MMKHRNRTLQQTLLSFIGLLFFVLLSISFVLSILMVRDNLNQQLSSHAQDTANSLGLSLSTVINSRDEVSAGRMIDALFDSGEYQQIVLFALNGDPIVIRKRTQLPSGVPQWFSHLMDLPSPKKTSEVMSGWTQLGTLVVESYSGFAEAELWQMLRAQLLWFVSIAILGLFGVHILLDRLLLPLKLIEVQARAMSAKQFSERAPLPRTRELAGVAKAMNDMADQLGMVFNEQLSLIESLRAKSFLDKLTGLGNREGFDARLKTELDSLQNSALGSLILIQMNHLSLLNDSKGRDEGDRFLINIASLISNLLANHQGAFAARRSAADFSIFLPLAISAEIDVIVEDLMNQLSSLSEIKRLLRDDCFHLGVACVQKGDTSSILLSKTDMALRQAQGKKVSGWQRYAYIEALDVNDEVREANEWRSILQEVLATRSLKLHTQKVFDRDNKLFYYQILSRIEVNNALIVASLFLPMAERFQLMVNIDQLVMEKVFAAFANGSLSVVDDNISLDPVFYCATLSESALQDVRFMSWLDEQMSEYPHVASNLMIEVSEHVVNYNEPALQGLSLLAKTHGFKVSIERFGVSTASFAYLQRIPIDVLKVDHSFIRSIQNNQVNQFFLRSAIQLAHGQSTKMIAVGVETVEEWDTLMSIGLDGAMGYYLERPAANAVFES